MPDITMCKGQVGAIECPLKDSCYRYTTKPSEFMQSYFVIVPFNKESKTCDYFWKEDQ